MKRLLSSLALALGLAVISFTARADTTNVVWQTNFVTLSTNSAGFLQLGGPLLDLVKNITTASNLAAYGYGTIGMGNKDFGGGAGVIYNLNSFVGTGARLDYLASTKTVYMPSFNIQLQAPIYFNANQTVGLIPFGVSGIATPISGKGSANGSGVGIFGAGLAVKVGKHFDLCGDYEKWSGFKGSYVRLGLMYKF